VKNAVIAYATAQIFSAINGSGGYPIGSWQNAVANGMAGGTIN